MKGLLLAVMVIASCGSPYTSTTDKLSTPDAAQVDAAVKKVLIGPTASYCRGHSQEWGGGGIGKWEICCTNEKGGGFYCKSTIPNNRFRKKWRRKYLCYVAGYKCGENERRGHVWDCTQIKDLPGLGDRYFCSYLECYPQCLFKDHVFCRLPYATHVRSFELRKRPWKNLKEALR